MAVRQSSLEGVELMADIEFYRGKRVFVTGHTGFKGTWLSKILLDAGAIVTGYALDPPTDPSLLLSARSADKCSQLPEISGIFPFS